ncbi:hypothetical protein BDF19DRAFT_462428 [Syncephalis fuscata]|nr:hypothetical protein BDF19DRAFT_462428 [Syncephalis fuscata]
MSLEVFWDKLDREVALMAQELLNSRFRSAPKPDIIGDLVCTHLDFGSQPPEIEIVDVTDPFPEFYLPDPQHTLSIRRNDVIVDSTTTTPNMDNNYEAHHYHSYNYENVDTSHEQYQHQAQTSLPLHDNGLAVYTVLPTSGHHSPHNNGQHKSVTATTNNTGWPLPTSGDNSFHDEMNGPLMNTESTGYHLLNQNEPSTAMPYTAYEQHLIAEELPNQLEATVSDALMEQNHEEDRIQHTLPDTYHTSPITAVHSSPLYTAHNEGLYSNGSYVNTPTTIVAGSSSGMVVGPEKRDSDVQVQVKIAYEGNLQLTIATELRLNFPSMAFLSLPIELTVTSFSFSGTAVIAYLHDRVNFCFMEPDEPGQSLIKDLRVESQIGDARKHVLKNVGKVEKFVVDLLRQIIDQDLVFPCYSSVDLVGPETNEGEGEEDEDEDVDDEDEDEDEDEGMPMEMLGHIQIFYYMDIM